MTLQVANCFTPELVISGLDILHLKVESSSVRARSECLMPAPWISPSPSLLPGLLLTEPTPDHSDKDIQVFGPNEKEEENRERQSTNPTGITELIKHTIPSLNR